MIGNITVTYDNRLTCKYDITIGYNAPIENGRYYISTLGNDGSTVYYLKGQGDTDKPLATTNIGEATLFDFTVVGNNQYTIKVGDDFLYVATTTASSNNDKVRIGSTEEIWEFNNPNKDTTDPDAYLLKTVRDSNPRYLTMYNDTQFNAYTGATTNRNHDTKFVKYVSVESVSLNKSETTLTLGSAGETLTASILPENASNKNVSWASNNSGVVSVLNGELTAVAPGTATITVTTLDGSKTDTCDVTVVRPSLSSIVLTPDTGSYNIGDVITITAAPNPAEAELPADLTYEIVSGSEFVSQNNNEFTVTGAGTLQVRATSATLPLVSSNVCEFTLVNVTKELVSIAVDATGAKIEFEVGDTPIYDGLIVTASYNVGEPEVVELSNPNLSVSFPGGCMTAAGTYNVTVSYTYEEITKSQTYQITVKEKLYPVTVAAGSNSQVWTINEHQGVKAGTGSKTGSASFELPIGAIKICFYAACWASKSVTMSLSSSETITLSQTTFELEADANISGSSTTVTTDQNESNYYYEVTISVALTKATTITVEKSSGTDNRFAIWGVSYTK